MSTQQDNNYVVTKYQKHNRHSQTNVTKSNKHIVQIKQHTYTVLHTPEVLITSSRTTGHAPQTRLKNNAAQPNKLNKTHRVKHTCTVPLKIEHYLRRQERQATGYNINKHLHGETHPRDVKIYAGKHGWPRA